tara:strand:- start:939 stop:1487 length:549 start_codon:yes stop_codon:yes gene_type:complete
MKEEIISRIQDDQRENLLKKLFGLLDSDEGRIGADAKDKFGNRFELKSGTKKSVTTTRDVGVHTLKKWLGKHWIVGFGKINFGKFEFEEIYYLSPNDMRGFCQKIEKKISPDLNIFNEVQNILKKEKYSSEKIERLKYLVNRGYTLNNPKIPYKYIVENGVLLKKWNKKILNEAINLRSKKI